MAEAISTLTASHKKEGNSRWEDAGRPKGGHDPPTTQFTAGLLVVLVTMTPPEGLRTLKVEVKVHLKVFKDSYILLQQFLIPSRH